jgi:(p)ppGpp synthase/HD superfamily hydrolase
LYGNTSLPYEQWIDSVSSELTFQFGAKTALIVMELTKVPYVKQLDYEYWTPQQIETEGYSPILKADHDHFYIERLSKASINTVLVKMGDRLHNLMTLTTATPEKIAKQIKETEEEYLPIFRNAASKSKIARNLCTKIRLQLLKLKKIQTEIK